MTTPTIGTYSIVNDNLFKSNDNLCHCVSEDFHMGAGIAKQFKRRFGHVAELLQTGTKTGGCTFLQVDKRKIFYLITKVHYWNKPTMNALESSLRVMCNQMLETNCSRIAMPKIGCGLDGLKWEEVEPMIKRELCEKGIDVTVYYM